MKYCLVFTRNKAIPEIIWSHRVNKAYLYLLNVMTKLYCLLCVQYKYSYISVDPLVRDESHLDCRKSSIFPVTEKLRYITATSTSQETADRSSHGACTVFVIPSTKWHQWDRFYFYLSSSSVSSPLIPSFVKSIVKEITRFFKFLAPELFF